MSRWRVMRPVWDRSSGKPERRWVPEPGLPVFDTPEAARRAYMERLMPEIAGQSDERIKLHYLAWSRNTGGAKLERAKD